MSFAPFETEFAHTVFRGKYPFTPDENWHGCAARVTSNVLGGLNDAPRHIDVPDQRILGLVDRREFIPGGRYLYGAGRDFHQVNNCLLLRVEDTRESWAELDHKARMALMTGCGIGVYYGDLRGKGERVKRTGGVSSGPVPLMTSVDGSGRSSVQGGDRRSAIWAGLRWNHPDAFEFIHAKDWPAWMREAIEKRNQGNPEYKDFHAPLEMTNISVCLDDEFFDAYEDEIHPHHALAWKVYWDVINKMVTTGEPGFSVDLGDKRDEVLRNAPVCADTCVLTASGYRAVGEIVGKRQSVWTGQRWATGVVFECSKRNAQVVAVQMTGGREIRCDFGHPFLVERPEGVVRVPACDLEKGDTLSVSLPATPHRGLALLNDAYTLGWIYGDGSFTQAGGADLTLCSEESKACVGLLSGASSINFNDSRGYTRLYFRVDTKWQGRTKARFPREVGEVGGGYAASFIAGLFDADGNWEPNRHRIRLASKHEGFLRDVGRTLEQLGIIAHVSKAGHSTYGGKQTYQLVVAAEYAQNFADVIPTQRLKVDLTGYTPYRPSKIKVLSVTVNGREDVYCADVKVPEHCFQAEGVLVSNCTEITSADDSDVCNLGSLVLPRYTSPEQFGAAVRDAVLFLTAGSLYSEVPYEKVAEIREKNRRLGLGLIGVHEFCMLNGVSYGSDESFEVLDPYMREYDRALEYAWDWQDRLGISRSVAASALAPNGTIGILAESTPSGDPMFSSARERVVITASPHGDVRTVHVVIDPVAKRLVDQGVDPNTIEDAYSLALMPERRLAMQAYLQSHVDQAVSSTLNLPHVMENRDEQRFFGESLMEFLPRLRGVTAYPDGARSGQPLKSVPLEWALQHEGKAWIESVEETCREGVCGV